MNEHIDKCLTNPNLAAERRRECLLAKELEQMEHMRINVRRNTMGIREVKLMQEEKKKGNGDKLSLARVQQLMKMDSW